MGTAGFSVPNPPEVRRPPPFALDCLDWQMVHQILQCLAGTLAAHSESVGEMGHDHVGLGGMRKDLPQLLHGQFLRIAQSMIGAIVELFNFPRGVNLGDVKGCSC